MSRYEELKGLWIPDRPTLDEDWDECCRLHEQARCSWWRAGIGKLVNRPGFNPAQRLAEEP